MLTILSLFALVLFSHQRLLTFLHILQQDAYLPKRYITWLLRHRAFDQKASCCLLISWILNTPSLSLIALLFFTYREKDPRKLAKVPLKMTTRAKEIFQTSWLLAITASTLLFFLTDFFALITIQSLPLLVLLALQLLSPKERKRQEQITTEAKIIFHSISPYVIGITGSYGKTSTKDLLSRLLQVTKGPTFWPPKGINTKMGICRSIREKMLPHTDFAVIEMAAYGKQSIAHLCKLCPPNAAILTQIGTAHLERFGSQKVIQQTKGELLEALPKQGIAVVNGDDPLIRELTEQRDDLTVLFFGQKGEDLCCKILSWKIVEEKKTLRMHFSLCWKGKTFTAKTPLLGEAALYNIAASFTMACQLGADPLFVLETLAHIGPVENRLQVQKTEKITFLHDAYNSNPKGFSAALKVLEKLQAHRRILLTPGMIELGDQHQTSHSIIASQAAKICDQILLVGPNSESLIKELQKRNFPQKNLLHLETKEEAFAYLQNNQQKGDAVLIENDLPDLYDNSICL